MRPDAAYQKRMGRSSAGDTRRAPAAAAMRTAASRGGALAQQL